jgi:glucokinase
VVGVTLGTGIGGGVLIDGRIWSGATGAAGEIGHQVIDLDGPECGCGNRGCVEALARSDVLCSMAGRQSVTEVYAAAADGDQRSRAAIATAARAIGIGLANVVTLLGPDIVVVGGGIASGGEAVLAPIRNTVRDHVTMAPSGVTHIVSGRLGSQAGAVGAALAARQPAVRAR